MNNLSHNFISFIRVAGEIAAAIVFICVARSHAQGWLACGIVFFYALIALSSADFTGRQIGIAHEIGHLKIDRLIRSGTLPATDETTARHAVDEAASGEAQQCGIQCIGAVVILLSSLISFLIP